MKKVLVPLAPGFEEIEAVTIIDVLRRANVEVVAAGLKDGLIEGSRGVRIQPDRSLDGIEVEELDMIALPGGLPGARALCADVRVQALLRRAHETGRVTAAICAAPTALAAAGLVAGRLVTGHPTIHEELAAAGALVRKEPRVVVDGTLVTSQGPGTAIEFAFALVEILCGAGRAAELNVGILARV